MQTITRCWYVATLTGSHQYFQHELYVLIKCINKSIISFSFSFKIFLELFVFQLFRVTLDDTPQSPERAWCVSMFPSRRAFIISTCMHNRGWCWTLFCGWAVAAPLRHPPPPPPLSVHLLLQARCLLKAPATLCLDICLRFSRWLSFIRCWSFSISALALSDLQIGRRTTHFPLFTPTPIPLSLTT